MKAKVAVLRTSPESVVDDFGKLMRMADYTDHLDKAAATHVGVNVSWDLWYPGCSTTPWQLEGVITALVDDGFSRDAIMLTRNNTGDAGDRMGESNNGLKTVADSFDMDFTRPREQPAEWITYEPRREMLVLDRVYQGEGIRIPASFPGTNIIHLPTVKTHASTGIAGAMGNALGGLVQDHGNRIRGVIHEVLVDMLAIQKEVHAGLFAVMDGTFCGDGPGPRMLMPFEKDIIIAGGDQVAIDAVAAKMMGFDPMEFDYIRLAHEHDLGCGDPEQIEIAGDAVDEVDFHFHHQNGVSGGRGRMVAAGALGGPLESAASRLFYEYYWHPYVGWPRASRMAETKWGQMLQGYLPAGAELERQGRSKLPFAAAAGAAALIGMSAFHRLANLARRG